jgi:hypothetical protein
MFKTGGLGGGKTQTRLPASLRRPRWKRLRSGSCNRASQAVPNINSPITAAPAWHLLGPRRGSVGVEFVAPLNEFGHLSRSSVKVLWVLDANQFL